MKTKILLLLGLLFLTPAGASADVKLASGKSVDAARLLPYLGIHGGGGLTLTHRDFDIRVHRDMRAGAGAGLRGEIPVFDYLTVMAGAEFGGVRAERADGHSLFLDVSIGVKGRVVLDVGPFDLELYLGVPMGLSVLGAHMGEGNDRNTGVGFGAGILGGAQFLFKRVGGVFLDMGPRFRLTRHGGLDGLGLLGLDEKIGLRTRQFNLNLGGVFYF